MTKITKRRIALVVLVAGLVAGFVAYRPDRALRVATGVVAHDVCSKAFVSGLEPGMVVAETLIRRGIEKLAWGMNVRIDKATGAVDVDLLSRAANRAIHRQGLGCVLVRPGVSPYQPATNNDILRQSGAEPLLPQVVGSEVVVPTNPALASALDHAFEEPATPPFRRTKAVVVMHDGRVIAERYAGGVGVDTPLMGFSLTKAMTNALLGRLVLQGRLSLSQPAPVGAWAGPGDARQAITIEHLMRMASGLDLDETNTGYDPSSRMLYLYDDMAAFAAKARPIAPPGTRFAYSSPSTVLLGRIMRDTLGGTTEAMLAFAWRELFHPLGMRTVTLETDGAGTPITSAYMFASARDWAKLGELYRRDGVAGGERLLPEGWVDFSAKATLGTYYGAGFWTARSDHPWARSWKEAGVPGDAFFGSGDLGQRLVVLPSQGIVIVRLGDAVDPSGDIRGITRLVREVVAATALMK